MEDAVLTAYTEAPLAWLSTTGADGPNVIPVGFKGMYDGKPLLVDLYFGKTRENLASQARVALAVATAWPKTGYQLKGLATVYTTGAPWEAARAVLRDAGVAAEPRSAVVIDVDEVYLLDPGVDAGKRLA